MTERVRHDSIIQIELEQTWIKLWILIRIRKSKQEPIPRSERNVYWISFDSYRLGISHAGAFSENVIKIKTYMLILNCCINVLSNRNRLSNCFILNISEEENKLAL